MESRKTRGLVTRRSDYGESSCMLTVLAEDTGVISVCAYGIHSKKNRLAAALQPPVFCEFVLSRKSDAIFRADSAEVLESFYPICEDIEKLALANYVCDIGRDAFLSGDGEVLSLILNTLYVLAYKNADLIFTKAVFELKLSQYMGYEPALDACTNCGSDESPSAFDFSGGVKCANCRGGADMSIDTGLHCALKYIFASSGKKIFAFTVSDDVKKRLSALAERYITGKSERNYKSLDYLKKIM